MRRFCSLFLASVVVAVLSGSDCLAQTAHLAFGEMELSVDAGSWRLERSTDDILMIVPIGKMADIARPIRVSRTTGADLSDCEKTARAQLPNGLYEQSMGRPFEIGGQKAVVVSGQTRCRNATPVGIAICAPYRGSAYVVTNRIEECRFDKGSPFSDREWFEKLIGGFRFLP